MQGLQAGQIHRKGGGSLNTEPTIKDFQHIQLLKVSGNDLRTLIPEEVIFFDSRKRTGT